MVARRSGGGLDAILKKGAGARNEELLGELNKSTAELSDRVYPILTMEAGLATSFGQKMEQWTELELKKPYNERYADVADLGAILNSETLTNFAVRPYTSRTAAQMDSIPSSSSSMNQAAFVATLPTTLIAGPTPTFDADGKIKPNADQMKDIALRILNQTFDDKGNRLADETGPGGEKGGVGSFKLADGVDPKVLEDFVKSIKVVELDKVVHDSQWENLGLQTKFDSAKDLFKGVVVKLKDIEKAVDAVSGVDNAARQAGREK